MWWFHWGQANHAGKHHLRCSCRAVVLLTAVAHHMGLHWSCCGVTTGSELPGLNNGLQTCMWEAIMGCDHSRQDVQVDGSTAGKAAQRQRWGGGGGKPGHKSFTGTSHRGVVADHNLGKVCLKHHTAALFLTPPL